MHTVDDIRSPHRRAVQASVAVVSRVQPADLGRPTPCAGWTLGDLLAHMTVQHLGFAAAAGGRGADPAVWVSGPLGPDPAADYARAAGQVLDAFAGEDVPQRPFALPEISTAVTFPGRQAIGFHLVDYVAHGWDVARSLGLPYELDAQVLDAALRVARAVPDGEARLAPGAAFRPVLPVPADAPALDRIVALLGRSPDWRAARTQA
jgi:uncharacterized protein (TIGR03086 family)